MLTYAFLLTLLAVPIIGIYQIPPVKRWWRRIWKKHFELILTIIIAVGFSLIVIPRIMQ
jgi:hypothetical protein